MVSRSGFRLVPFFTAATAASKMVLASKVIKSYSNIILSFFFLISIDRDTRKYGEKKLSFAVQKILSTVLELFNSVHTGKL
jgi:hypothetical protein